METDDLQPALAALGHRTRLAIVQSIAASADRTSTPSAIADTLGIQRNLLSAHLLVLERVGLVTAEENGRNRFLRLNAERFDKVGSAVIALGG